jgi:uncharacterized protein (TIGR02145 family)
MKAGKMNLTGLAALAVIMLSVIGGCKKDSGEIRDGDGNIYTTVTIGSQVWLKENLRTTKYKDGTTIPHVTGDAWETLLTPAYCWFGDVEANKDIYGGLYNLFAVKTDKLCPNGFHVPSRGDLLILTDFLGADAGGRMKSMTMWSVPNEGASNSSGFTALPGGMRTSAFIHNGMYAYYWTSTLYNTNSGYFVTLSYDNALVQEDHRWGSSGLSVRCVQD